MMHAAVYGNSMLSSLLLLLLSEVYYVCEVAAGCGCVQWAGLGGHGLWCV